MSSAIKDIFLTLHGQEVDGLSVAIGETVDWHLTLQDSTTLDAFNLTGANVVLALSKLDARSQPLAPPIFARQADIVVAADGTALAQWVAGDTYRTPALAPGMYGLEVWLTDADGNRLASLPVGRVRLTASSYAPAGDITPLPAQDPLARGPAGPAGVGGAIGDAVSGATAKSVLFIDGTGHLAQSQPVFTYDPATFTLSAPSLASLSVDVPPALSAFGVSIGTTNAASVHVGRAGQSVVADANLSTTTGTPGNWTMGGQLQGVSASTNSFFKYVPTDVNADPFFMNHDEETGGGLLARHDHGLSIGWNLGSGGGLVNSGTRRGAIGWSFEQYWEQTPGDTSTAQMEAHLLYVQPNGTQVRPISILAGLNSPYVTTLFLDATHISMGSGPDSNVNAQLTIGPETTAIYSTTQYNAVMVDDNVGGGVGYARIHSGKVATGTSRAYVQVSDDGNATIVTHGTGIIGDVGSSLGQFRWGSNYTDVFSADGSAQILLTNDPTIQFLANNVPKFVVSPGEVSTRNTLLRLYWPNIGTNTRLDQAAGIMLDSQTAASGGSTSEYSPGVFFKASAWTGSVAQPTDFMVQVKNTTGATPTAKLAFSYSVDDTNGAEVASIDNTGALTAGSATTVVHTLTAGGHTLTFDSSGVLKIDGVAITVP
jgi:hypothetical protein